VANCHPLKCYISDVTIITDSIEEKHYNLKYISIIYKLLLSFYLSYMILFHNTLIRLKILYEKVWTDRNQILVIINLIYSGQKMVCVIET